MRNTIMLFALALAVSGCTALLTGINTAGDRICTNKEAAQTALSLGLVKAESISDETKRKAAVEAIHVSLAVLARCPEPI